MNDDEDFFVDDIIGNYKEKKKKVNSKDKGVRGEKDLCDILTKRFNEPFVRVVGSGNRWSQVTLPEHAKHALTGDLVTPENFLFVIEVKFGYADIDLSSCFENGHKQIDAFLAQAEKDANRINKLPMLCWRKPRHNWLVFIKDKIKTNYSLQYKDWHCMSLTELLKKDDCYFYSI